MLILSNRDVYLFGEEAPGGIYAAAIWLKEKGIAGTNQQLWNRESNTVHGDLVIPKTTAQVHTDIFLPYVTDPMAATASNA